MKPIWLKIHFTKSAYRPQPVPNDHLRQIDLEGCVFVVSNSEFPNRNRYDAWKRITTQEFIDLLKEMRIDEVPIMPSHPRTPEHEAVVKTLKKLKDDMHHYRSEAETADYDKSDRDWYKAMEFATGYAIRTLAHNWIRRGK